MLVMFAAFGSDEMDTARFMRPISQSNSLA